MAGILVFSEKKETALELLSKGKEIKGILGGRLGVFVAQSTGVDAGQFFSRGADAVVMSQQTSVAVDGAACAEAIAQSAVSHGFDLVMIGSTRTGKEMAAMVAQRVGAACVTDATDVRIKDGELLVDRYCLGGATVASVVMKTQKKVIAVMPRTFQIGAAAGAQGEIISFTPQISAPGAALVQSEEKRGESTPIEEAETLVCIGRGLSSQKDVPLIEDLAKALNAEIGCTRPLTHDWQWFSESREVGLSGKKCKPTLCLSVGISGQIQHTVGIRNSRVIAAINKDKNAPIFKTADYGLVADLYDVIPRLIKKIQAIKQR
jgi:electron transfer flavoprotein alpha subunit